MDDMTRTLPHPHASQIHEQHVSDERTAEEARLLLESMDEKVRALPRTSLVNLADWKLQI